MDNTYLKQKRQVWYVVIRVPRPLAGIIGRSHLQRSLGTRDVVEARKRRHAVVTEFQQVIEAAKANSAGHGGLVGETLAYGHLLRQQVKTGIMSREQAREDFDHMLDKLDHLPHISTLDDKSQAIREEQSKAIRDAGEAISHPKFHLSDGITFYETDNPKLRPSTIKQRTSRLTAFMKWAGDVPMESIVRKKAGEYVGEVLQQQGLTDNTIRQTLGDLSSWYRLMIDRGVIDCANPFDGLARTIRGTFRGIKGSTENHHRAWSDGELLALLEEAKGEGRGTES